MWRNTLSVSPLGEHLTRSNDTSYYPLPSPEAQTLRRVSAEAEQSPLPLTGWKEGRKWDLACYWCLRAFEVFTAVLWKKCTNQISHRFLSLSFPLHLWSFPHKTTVAAFHPSVIRLKRKFRRYCLNITACSIPNSLPSTSGFWYCSLLLSLSK